jgi:hypothetical protein
MSPKCGLPPPWRTYFFPDRRGQHPWAVHDIAVKTQICFNWFLTKVNMHGMQKRKISMLTTGGLFAKSWAAVLFSGSAASIDISAWVYLSELMKKNSNF